MAKQALTTALGIVETEHEQDNMLSDTGFANLFGPNALNKTNSNSRFSNSEFQFPLPVPVPISTSNSASSSKTHCNSDPPDGIASELSRLSSYDLDMDGLLRGKTLHGLKPTQGRSGVLFKGNLFAGKGVPGGQKAMQRIFEEGPFAATFRKRFFALLAFEPRSMARSKRLGKNERTTRATNTTENSNSYDYQRQGATLDIFASREVMLCWFPDEDAFDKLEEKLKLSDRIADAFECYFAESQNGKQVFSHPQFLGHLLLSSCTSIRESIKLDLPEDLYSAIEIKTKTKTYVLGCDDEDEFRTWLRWLKGMRRGDELANFIPDEPCSETAHYYQAVTKMLEGIDGTNPLGAKSRGNPANLNKWKQEVGMPFAFHIGCIVLCIWSVLWIFCLVFLMNPFLQPCRKGPLKTYVDSDGYCRLRKNDEWYDLCTNWEGNAATLTFLRSWVTTLEVIGFWSELNHYEGEDQICFEKPSIFALIWFWGFAITEMITCYSTIMVVGINWRTTMRGARFLDEMCPDFPKEYWPTVDVLICHYGEPAEETMQTLMKCLAMEYPPNKFHIYICDDGHYKSDFKDVDAGNAFWPRAKRNQGLMDNSGDVRQELEDLMKEHLSDPGDADSTVPSRAPSTSTTDKFAPSDEESSRRRLVIEKRDFLPDPSNPERQVPRVDCAVGYQEDVYRMPGLAPVSYSGRLKPRVHHSKAGNINNVLYNIGSTGDYTVIFDNDMEPHPKFLISCLPLFFELEQSAWASYASEKSRFSQRFSAQRSAAMRKGFESEASENNERKVRNHPSLRSVGSLASQSKYPCPYTDSPERNYIAFVQTPQYFRKNDLMIVDGDPLSHNNHAFFDSCLHSMDAYDSAMFVGTNVVWRREALDSVGGIQYGTISEDFWTGHMAHWLGWDSAYMRKDRQGKPEDRFHLAEGSAPDSAAASLTQRKRWHKGAVELFVGVKNVRDQSWKPPDARIPTRPVPASVKFYREFHWFFARLAWVGSVIPPLFYTVLVIGGLWSNTLWIYLNPNPALFIMIPRLWLTSFVPTLGDITVPAEQLLSSFPEFFTYAPIRLVGTIEAFQEKITGRAAKWGNTGGVGRGDKAEIPNILICFLISTGLVRSILYWSFFEVDKDMYELIPIWLFSLIILNTFWKFARVSIQEYFGWNYKSLHGGLLFQWFSCAGIMTITVLLMIREDRINQDV